LGSAVEAAGVVVPCAMLDPALNTVAPMAPPATIEPAMVAAITRLRTVFIGFTSLRRSGQDGRGR
jgi:hypothetical protein